MMMYKNDQKSSPCSLFSDRIRISASNDDSIPWMYYEEGEAPAVLSRKKITTQFNLRSDSQVGTAVAKSLKNNVLRKWSKKKEKRASYCHN